MNDEPKPEHLGLSPEDFDALRVRSWAPIPPALREAFRKAREDVAAARRRAAATPPGTALRAAAEKAVEWARERERSILALPWLAVGEEIPDAVPEGRNGDDPFLYLDLAEAIREMLHLRKPARAKRVAALHRMDDAALRAARLCRGEGAAVEDALPFLPKVRKLGIASFLSVIEKAEGMKQGETPDKDGKKIRNWSAYLDAMLDKAQGKARPGAVGSKAAAGPS